VVLALVTEIDAVEHGGRDGQIALGGVIIATERTQLLTPQTSWMTTTPPRGVPLGSAL